MNKRLVLIGSVLAGLVVAGFLPVPLPVAGVVGNAHAAVAVPGPSSLVLVAVSLGALAWWSRRRS